MPKNDCKKTDRDCEKRRLEKFSASDKINLDEIDLTFLGFAAAVKKLFVRQQILLKLKIAKLIMEEELVDFKPEEQAGTSSCFPSCISSSNCVCESLI